MFARNNCILYAVSEKNIISIKDGKVGKYTGTDALFYQDNGMHLQIFPDLSSQASELPNIIRQVFNIKDEYLLRFIAQLLCFYIPDIKYANTAAKWFSRHLKDDYGKKDQVLS